MPALVQSMCFRETYVIYSATSNLYATIQPSLHRKELARFSKPQTIRALKSERTVNMCASGIVD